MRNYYRLQTRPIRRYRMTQPGDFPLLESVNAAMRENNGLAAEPAKLPVNQPDTRAILMNTQVDDPQATSPDTAAAISRQGDVPARRDPSDAGSIVAAAIIEIPGHGMAEDVGAMPTTPDNKNRIIPASRPDGALSGPGDTALAVAPFPAPIPAEDVGINAPKIPFRQKVEDWLKQEKLPYIRVDEAKRALFAGARLRSFHLVVYMATTGPNWLVWAVPLAWNMGFRNGWPKPYQHLGQGISGCHNPALKLKRIRQP